MNLNLKNRVSLVTGSCHGLGLAIAKTLAQNKAKVYLCSLKHAEVVKAAESIKGNVEALEVDVTSLKSIKKMFNQLSAKEKKIDILVNNVGGALKFGDFESLNDNDWIDAFLLNCMSSIRVSRNALPLLRKSKAGRIINIGSLNSHQPGNFNPHYGTAKTGLLYLNKYLANFLGKDGITVNTICPSTIQGGAWYRNIADYARRENISSQEAEKRFIEIERKKSPLDKICQLEDIADLIIFLVSDRGKFMTGEVFDVDGGIRKSIK